MLYFIIFPIYALLFMGFLLLSVIVLFIKPLRQWSSYLVFGALGTLPGFVIGNILFWLIVWGLLSLLHESAQEITSDIAKAVAIICFVGGLAVTNIVGCTAGFLGGIRLRSKVYRSSQ